MATASTLPALSPSNGKSSQCQGCTRLLAGVAPDANLINLRVLDQNGEGSDSTVIAAIEDSDRSERSIQHPSH